MFLWRRLSGSTSTPASDSAVKCSSCTQGVLCFSGRETSTIQMRGCFLFYTDNVWDATFNWVNLKTCCVCMCVYLCLIGGVSSQCSLLILELKHLYRVHRRMCGNWHFSVCLAALQPGLILGHRLPNIVRKLLSLVQYWYSGNAIVQRSVMDWGNH